MVIFIIVPVVLLIYFSFLDINGHFSFRIINKFLLQKYLKMFAYSFLYVALITIITLAMLSSCHYITRSKFQNILLMIMIIPTHEIIVKDICFIGLFKS